MADKVESEHGIVCRNFASATCRRRSGRFLEVYNAAWERNWGFVPLTEREVRHYAKELKPILDENWAMVAERKDTGEVVGAALTLPDYNQVLAKLRRRGRLLPFGWLTALRERRKIDAVRVFALGVKPAYQHTGVAARFYQMHFDAAETHARRGAARWAGSSRSNKPMNRAMEGMGGEISAPLPLYERKLWRPRRRGADGAGKRSERPSTLRSVSETPNSEAAQAGLLGRTTHRRRRRAIPRKSTHCPCPPMDRRRARLPPAECARHLSGAPRASRFRPCRPPRWPPAGSWPELRSCVWSAAATRTPPRSWLPVAAGEDWPPFPRQARSFEDRRAHPDRRQPLAARRRASAGRS